MWDGLAEVVEERLPVFERSLRRGEIQGDRLDWRNSAAQATASTARCNNARQRDAVMAHLSMRASWLMPAKM